MKRRAPKLEGHEPVQITDGPHRGETVNVRADQTRFTYKGCMYARSEHGATARYVRAED